MQGRGVHRDTVKRGIPHVRHFLELITWLIHLAVGWGGGHCKGFKNLYLVGGCGGKGEMWVGGRVM